MLREAALPPPSPQRRAYRSPMPLMVPCTCTTPSCTACSVLATARPPSLWTWMPSCTSGPRAGRRHPFDPPPPRNPGGRSVPGAHSQAHPVGGATFLQKKPGLAQGRDGLGDVGGEAAPVGVTQDEPGGVGGGGMSTMPDKWRLGEGGNQLVGRTSCCHGHQAGPEGLSQRLLQMTHTSNRGYTKWTSNVARCLHGRRADFRINHTGN